MTIVGLGNMQSKTVLRSDDTQSCILLAKMEQLLYILI